MTQTTTNYRETILKIADRYAQAGEDWETNLLAGSLDEIIDRNAALSIADWLETEADQEWGADPRHRRIAADIRAALAAAKGGAA